MVAGGYPRLHWTKAGYALDKSLVHPEACYDYNKFKINKHNKHISLLYNITLPELCIIYLILYFCVCLAFPCFTLRSKVYVFNIQYPVLFWKDHNIQYRGRLRRDKTLWVLTCQCQLVS